jgi:hypothetical protein
LNMFICGLTYDEKDEFQGEQLKMKSEQ